MAEAMLPPPMKARVLCWREGILKVGVAFAFRVWRREREREREREEEKL
jgi:hypothetical protein